MQTLWQDLRYGARMLWRKPGFTIVAVLTLALGIGANTAIFSVVHSVLLKPLDYPEADRILTVWEDHTRREGPAREWATPPGFQDWRDQNSVFTGVAAVNNWGPTLTETGEPEMLAGASVSHDAFSILGVKPFLGREFTPEEDRAGAEKVVIISRSLWERRLGSDPSIIGRAIRLSGESYTVVGVMPAGFQLPFVNNVEVWRTLNPRLQPGCQRGCYTLRVIARLRPEVTLERAQAELSTIAGRLESQYQDTNKNVGVSLVPLHEFIVGDLRQPLFALLLAVGFVLLIACANVANLQLVNASAREREMAVRAALGAGRFRIIRQLLAESMLLALIGGATGTWLAFWLVDALKSISPAGTPRLDEIAIDGRALLFGLVVSALTGLLCGLAPALQSTRRDLQQALREASGSEKAGGLRLRSSLVVSEIAIALTLLIGAGLLTRSFIRLQSVDPGFNPSRVLTARIILPANAYPDRATIASFFDRLDERLQALPGVEAVSFSSSAPMTGINTDTSFTIEGRPAPPPDRHPVAWFSVVSPDYFRTMDIPLRAGRLFEEREGEGTPRVVVISESMARRYWPGESPVGKRIGFGGEQVEWREIAGVVGDVRHFGLSTDLRPTMYFSNRQVPRAASSILLRVGGEPLDYVAQMRRVVAALDKNLAISGAQDMEELVAATIAVPRLLTMLFGGFAALALLLASLGIYGVMAYSVVQRTREIGIRVALGAQGGDVLRMVLRHGMKLALIGIAFGLIASLALTRWMKTLLFSTSASDPLTFVAIALLFVAVALLACFIPARRATKVDPLVALRYE